MDFKCLSDVKILSIFKQQIGFRNHSFLLDRSHESVPTYESWKCYHYLFDNNNQLHSKLKDKSAKTLFSISLCNFMFLLSNFLSYLSLNYVLLNLGGNKKWMIHIFFMKARLLSTALYRSPRKKKSVFFVGFQLLNSLQTDSNKVKRLLLARETKITNYSPVNNLML